jgi:hypothetical protein
MTKGLRWGEQCEEDRTRKIEQVIWVKGTEEQIVGSEHAVEPPPTHRERAGSPLGREPRHELVRIGLPTSNAGSLRRVSEVLLASPPLSGPVPASGPHHLSTRSLVHSSNCPLFHLST